MTALNAPYDSRPHEEAFDLLERPALRLRHGTQHEGGGEDEARPEEGEHPAAPHHRNECAVLAGDEERERPVGERRGGGGGGPGVRREDLGDDEHRDGTPADGERRYVGDERDERQPGKEGVPRGVVGGQREAGDGHADAGDNEEDAPAGAVHQHAGDRRDDDLDGADGRRGGGGAVAPAGGAEDRHGVEHDDVDAAQLLEGHEGDADDEGAAEGGSREDLEEGEGGVGGGGVGGDVRLDLAALRLDVVDGATQRGKRAKGVRAPAGRQQVAGRLGGAEGGRRRRHRQHGAERGQRRPVEERAGRVRRHDADGDRQLDAGAERAAQRLRTRLGDVHRRRHRDDPRRDARQQAASAQLPHARPSRDQQPARQRRHRRRQQRPPAATLRDQPPGRRTPHQTAECHRRAEPRLLTRRQHAGVRHRRQRRRAVPDDVTERQRPQVGAERSGDQPTHVRLRDDEATCRRGCTFWINDDDDDVREADSTADKLFTMLFL